MSVIELKNAWLNNLLSNTLKYAKKSSFSMILLLGLLVAPVQAAGATPVYVDGQLSTDLSAAVYTLDGSMMVPLAILAPSLKIDVKPEPGNAVSLSRRVQDESVCSVTLRSGDRYLFVDGKRAVVDPAPKIRDGELTVPLRAISKYMDISVKWHARSETVHLFTLHQSESAQQELIQPIAKAWEEEQQQRMALKPADGDEVINKREIPILEYHEIAAPPANAESLRYLYVERERFAQSLNWLYDQGYTTITLMDLYTYWTTGRGLPDHPILLTFDDGYESIYSAAFPELKKRNMVGNFFISTSLMGRQGHVNEEMIQEMSREGMLIGSHTVNHNNLRQETNLELELHGSQQALEALTGEPVLFLSYPYGLYNQKVVEAVQLFGYRAAICSQRGISCRVHGFYNIRRIPVVYEDDLTRFKEKVRGQ